MTPTTMTTATSPMLARAARVLGESTTAALVSALVSGNTRGDELADAAYLTMPEELAATLRLASGVPVAYAVSCIARECDSASPSTATEQRACARAAWQCVLDRMRLANDVEEGFGFDRSDAWETVREVELGQYARAQLEAIAQLAGRMYEALRGVRAKREDATPLEVKDVTLGGDLTRLLASEMAQLGSSCTALSTLASMRVLERRAMQLRYPGEHEVGRGPLVIALDESGSMHAQRNVWAKSAAVALTRIAHEAGRVVRVVHFSQATAVTECKPGDRAALLRVATHFLSGGTAIASAVACAARQVADLDARGWTGADIVTVTDGVVDSCEDTAITEHMKRVAASGVRFWTVAIECSIDGSRSLRSGAQRYLEINNTSDAASIKGLSAAADASIVR